MRRACIYTAIYADYDPLRAVPAQDLPCDLVCFTDNAAIPNPGGWRIIHAPVLPGSHPRTQSKYFKILHQRAFAGSRLALGGSLRERLFGRRRYDHTIWIDGSIQVKSPRFAREFIGHVGSTGWSMFVHPDRSCIYPEAELSKQMPKYFSQAIDAQIQGYRAERYPPDNGLVATGLIARSTSADLGAISEAWWKEVTERSYQDQLSLPVVLWRLRQAVDPVRKDLWKNDWFDWIPHASPL